MPAEELAPPAARLQGWVFGALDDEDSSALYYSFGLLYALPYLVSGLQLDAFALAALAAGAAHMQVRWHAHDKGADTVLGLTRSGPSGRVRPSCAGNMRAGRERGHASG